MRRGSSRSWSRVVSLVVLLVGAVALVVLVGSHSGAAAASAAARGYVPPVDCHAVKFVGVRGSGDGSSTLGVIATAISGELAKKAKAAGVDYAGYGLPYAAVGIDWRKLTNTTTAAVLAAQYRLSEREGRNNLRTLIREQVRDCPQEKLVVEGYSQGAHAVGDVFSEAIGGLSANELGRVKVVALIADPRFNSREPFDAGSYRTGRNGILGARTPGDLSAVANRIKAWCQKDDIVCQGPGTTSNHAQEKYLADYTQQIVSFIAAPIGVAPLAATKIVGVRPVDKFSRRLPEYHVSRELNGGQCEDGSDQVGPAYRCFSGNGVYDPCWAEVKSSDGQTPYVLCMSSPWDTNVVEIRSPTGLGTTSGSGGAVWGVNLSDGTKCVSQDGAVDSFQGKAVRFYCGNHTYLLDTLSKSTRTWTIEEIHADASYHYSEVGVKKIALAWEGLPNQF
jgi:hypothetical protein